MIPVLGVPILSSPNLLYEMIESINVPVGRLYVVDNGNVVDPSRINGDVYVPGRNLGVAASWNNIITSNPDAPWLAIMNFDLVFAPGDLPRLVDHMETKGGVALLGVGFAAFALDRGAIENVGLFDENFYPAYFEDNDYDYRCRLASVPIVALPAAMTHKISSTLNSNPAYRDANARTFPQNGDYFRRKWGGTPYQEVYTTPFNEGGDIRSWQLDEKRLAAQSWT
jgi:GT2 family glycosyltransferase